MKPIPPFVPQRSKWGDYLQTLMILAMTISASFAIANLLPIEFNLLSEPLITDEMIPVSRIPEVPLTPQTDMVVTGELAHTNALPVPFVAEKFLTSSHSLQIDEELPSKLKPKKHKKLKYLGVYRSKKPRVAYKHQNRQPFRRQP